tara:strand:- start:37 stop:279 length:243 start_codon:yes stop_codon:yes gene_type:complete
MTWKDILKEDELAYGDFDEMDKRAANDQEVVRIMEEFSPRQRFKGSREQLLSAIRGKIKLLGGHTGLEKLERRLLKVMEK